MAIAKPLLEVRTTIIEKVLNLTNGEKETETKEWFTRYNAEPLYLDETHLKKQLMKYAKKLIEIGNLKSLIDDTVNVSNDFVDELFTYLLVQASNSDSIWYKLLNSYYENDTKDILDKNYKEVVLAYNEYHDYLNSYLGYNISYDVTRQDYIDENDVDDELNKSLTDMGLRVNSCPDEWADVILLFDIREWMHYEYCRMLKRLDEFDTTFKNDAYDNEDEVIHGVRQKFLDSAFDSLLRNFNEAIVHEFNILVNHCEEDDQ